MDKIIGRRILHFSLAMTAIVAIAGVVYLLTGGSGAMTRSQQEPLDKIAIIAIAPNATGDRIDAWVKNVGLGPISLIEKAEILVMATSVTFNVIKHSATRGYNTWVEDPVGSAWDPANTLHIIITLPAGSPLTAGKYMLRVSTAAGTNVDKSFDVG